MLLYGYGDGGGGPTEDMIEKLNRVKDTDGLPKVVLSSPQKFFKSLDEDDSSKLCTWIGELYLELHQGTFTVQANIKDGNRRSEFLLHDVEFMSSIALAINKNHIAKDSFSYPVEELKRLWKLLLLNQFHDVIPGSCINEAVVDAFEYYADIRKSGTTLLEHSLDTIIRKSCSENISKTSQLIAFNTHCWPRRAVVQLPDAIPEKLVTQKLKCGGTLALVDVPSMGYSVVASDPEYEACSIQVLQDSALVVFKNKFLTAKLDRCGRMVSLVHNKSGRDIIAPGCHGNQFVMFDNVPLYWDAWDVMPYHLETRKEVSEIKDGRLEIIEEGPLRVSAKVSLYL
ncbi:alpha-mannosidase 2C1-like [Paramuricea clavata]|uniref:Alpha-mannosidase 2C1-like n=1 Tax=Paramuricea clavata TaxID=317549 RepID=A0A6S7HSP7_PARCT|nr:alpha-mannosidase 2C1-like [Paramuricea clavata]